MSRGCSKLISAKRLNANSRNAKDAKETPRTQRKSNHKVDVFDIVKARKPRFDRGGSGNIYAPLRPCLFLGVLSFPAFRFLTCATAGPHSRTSSSIWHARYGRTT